MVKTQLTEAEQYGLSTEEIKLALKYMRKNRTYSILSSLDAAKLYELYLLGDTITKIASQFPQYPLGQICLTAALKGWGADRDKMLHTLQDRVKAKVVKSVLSQIDFLTSMMAVANAEHLEAMVKYIQDPINNPKPEMRINSIKEYKDVSETLYKIVAGAVTPSTKSKEKSPMFEALTNPSPSKRDDNESEDINILDVVDK